MSKSRAEYSAFDTAVYYITFKDRTKKELSDKLKEKGYSSHEIEESIGKLLEYGYINDENYAFSYIKDNINKKGLGRISMELLRKGIDKDIVCSKLDLFEENEADVIGELMSRRYKNSDFNDDSERRRIYSYFARRGFKYENISKAITNYKKSLENYN